jgi:uncharacterized glyoxalase superfamily protein PhnB
MKPAPKNWTRISSAAYYQDAAQAIDWLCKAFGFEVRLRVDGDGGVIVHSELTFGDGIVMVADERNNKRENTVGKSPRSVGGANTQSIMVYVDDVEAHHDRAKAAGAKVTHPPETSDYGEDYWSDRSYECEDLEGHRWWFCQRLRDVK